MGDPVRIERLIRILQLLSSGRDITVKQLHKYFEQRVSKRTLQRDLVELSSANIPLVTRQGKGKQLVWSVDSGYLRFIPQVFGSREIAAASLMKQFMNCFLGTFLEEDAQLFFDKARQLYPPSAVIESDAVDHLKLLAFSKTGYIDYRPFTGIIRSLLDAITQQSVVRLRYKPIWKQKTSVMDIHPYMILHHKEALYVMAYYPKRSKYVSLPVQRIKSAEAIAKRFRRRSDFDWEQLFKDRIGIFGHEGQKPARVVLRFDSRVAEVVAERIWHASQQIKKHRDGSITMELKVVISDELRSWVASWLDYVKVELPKNLLPAIVREHDER